MEERGKEELRAVLGNTLDTEERKIGFKANWVVMPVEILFAFGRR